MRYIKQRVENRFNAANLRDLGIIKVASFIYVYSFNHNINKVLISTPNSRVVNVNRGHVCSFINYKAVCHYAVKDHFIRAFIHIDLGSLASDGCEVM